MIGDHQSEVKPWENDFFKDVKPNARIIITQQVLNMILKYSGFK